jgi:curved DNA-binding protein CbpA
MLCSVSSRHASQRIIAPRLLRCADFIPLLPTSFPMFARRSATTSSSSSTRQTYYHVLSLPHTATAQEVKEAFRRRALECHPDTAASDKKATAEADFRRACEAYETLSSEAKRRQYDREMGIKRSTDTPSSAVGAKAPSSDAARRMKAASRGMVRREADAVFAEAFHGKSIHDILFSARFAKKFGSKQASDASSPRFTTTTVDDAWKQAADAAAERAKRNAESLRPPWSRRTDGGGRSPPSFGTAAATDSAESTYPGSHMPFRPFPGMELPPGITFDDVPPLPKAERLSLDGNMDMSLTPPTPIPSPVVEGLASGNTAVVAETQRRMGAHNARPPNLGQIYSYQRPY